MKNLTFEDKRKNPELMKNSSGHFQFEMKPGRSEAIFIVLRLYVSDMING